jgi:hypothetical protein
MDVDNFSSNEIVAANLVAETSLIPPAESFARLRKVGGEKTFVTRLVRARPHPNGRPAGRRSLPEMNIIFLCCFAILVLFIFARVCPSGSSLASDMGGYSDE